MSRFLNVLRSWLLMVSVIAVGNTVQSFRDHSFLSQKLYTGTPEYVNGLQARTFGIWTLLSAIIRCACAIDIQNIISLLLNVRFNLRHQEFLDYIQNVSIQTITVHRTTSTHVSNMNNDLITTRLYIETN
uniref:Ergosterol biosynthesis 28 homolog n=1 Tax=Sinocyclocheilus anshuiensis TaxID=1608454 RepID=A0A671Q6R2_9TELE